jgi:hypothetical protein
MTHEEREDAYRRICTYLSHKYKRDVKLLARRDTGDPAALIMHVFVNEDYLQGFECGALSITEISEIVERLVSDFVAGKLEPRPRLSL